MQMFAVELMPRVRARPDWVLTKWFSLPRLETVS